MKLLIFLAAFGFIVSSTPCSSQDGTHEDSLATQKDDYLAIYPLVFYLPETKLGLGLTSAYQFYPGPVHCSRPSQLRIGAAYTFNKQLLVFTFFNLFLNRDRSDIFGELGYYDFFYPYYGIGNDTDIDVNESYNARFPRIKVNYLHRIMGDLRAGVRIAFDAYNIASIERNGLLDNDKPIGWEGGTIGELGALVRYDDRDMVYYPSKGFIVTFQVNSSLLSTDYDYAKWSLDASGYRKIKDEHIIATNFYIGDGNGSIPFQELFFLGGANQARGEIKGRYRDKSVLLGQVEYRFPIFKRIRGAAFVSSGTVATKPERLMDNYYHSNYGLGLRYTLDQENKVNIRFDIGTGADGPNFYLTLGEAF